MSTYPKSILTLFALVTLSIAAAPVSAGEPNLVEVPLDIDVYDHPGGEGKPRSQFLKGGSQVDLLEQNADSWCHVAGANDPVPGGSGWIWCGQGDDGKDYSVKPVAAGAGGSSGPEDDGAMEPPVDETPEPMEEDEPAGEEFPEPMEEEEPAGEDNPEASLLLPHFECNLDTGEGCQMGANE